MRGSNGAVLLAFFGCFFFPSFLESGVDCHPDFPRGSTFRMKRPPKEVLQEGHVSVCIKKTHGNIHVSNINNICTYCHCWTPLNPNKTQLSHSLGSRDSLPPPPPNGFYRPRLTTGWVRAGCLTHIPNKTSQDPDLRFLSQGPTMAQGAKEEFGPKRS